MATLIAPLVRTNWADDIIAGVMVILGILTPFGTIHRAVQLPSFTPSPSWSATSSESSYSEPTSHPPSGSATIASCTSPSCSWLFVMLMAPSLSRMTFPVMGHYLFLIGVIPLAMIVALFLFDLFSQPRVPTVTAIGGLVFRAADPVSDWLGAMPFSHHLVLWAQHHSLT